MIDLSSDENWLIFLYGGNRLLSQKQLIVYKKKKNQLFVKKLVFFFISIQPKTPIYIYSISYLFLFTLLLSFLLFIYLLSHLFTSYVQSTTPFK